MRYQVKRSLLFWPAVASFCSAAICWIALSNDPVSRQILVRSAQLWERAGGSVFWESSDSVTSSSASVRVASANDQTVKSNELLKISDWNDLVVEVPANDSIGIPAPSLNANSDLFGFPLVESSAAERRQNGSAAMPVPERLTKKASDSLDAADEPLVAMDSEANDSPDLVLQIDDDLLFADDPSDARDSAVDADEVAVSKARPSDVSLPLVLEPPSAFVAALPSDAFGDLDDSYGNSFDDAARANVGFTNSASAGLGHSPIVEPSLASLPAPKVSYTEQEPQPQSQIKRPSRSLAKPRPEVWPIPTRLLEQLDALEQVSKVPTYAISDVAYRTTTAVGLANAAMIAAWSQSTRTVLTELAKMNRLGDRRVAGLLDELEQLRHDAAVRAEQQASDEMRVAWLQAMYSLERRLAVWKPIHDINSGNLPDSQHVTDDVFTVARGIERLRAALPMTGDVDGWNAFLVLDELEQAFLDEDESARSEVSQKFLARLSWPNLIPMHRSWLESEPVVDLARAVRPWATSAIDYSSLLHQIERAESNSIDLVTSEIAHSMKALRFAKHQEAQTLSRNLDLHYRNANFRFALGEDLLNHLLPVVPTRSVPVRTTILGSRVTGISQIQSDIALQVVPAPHHWELQLVAVGDVKTRSVGRRGPAAVSTVGANQFSAATSITIKPTDVSLGRSTIGVSGTSRLRGIKTDYDGWPLVGNLVRSIAESEYRDKATLADRIATNRIRQQIGSEFERDLQTRIDTATDKFTATVIGPLNKMRLSPSVIDMETTESRLIARYRMAGDWQLAAMTPRPRAPGDSLLSVQMHQSAINNTLEQLVDQSAPQPVKQFFVSCFELLGISLDRIPEEIPTDVSIQFAKHRPVTVEIEDGKVWITLRVIRLEKGDRLKLTNFIVRAAYEPQVEGLEAKLVRSGHLSISGPNMSMRQRFPLRAIFNKVLSPNQAIPLTKSAVLEKKVPDSLAITQLELRDGWLGIALGPDRQSAQIATQAESTVQR